MSNITFAALELRVPDVSERIVEGIVVPWDETSFLTPEPNGERFSPGSLSRTIEDKAKKRQVIKLFRNHDLDRAVGTSVAWDPEHPLGCWAQFRIGSGAAGDDVLTEVGEGLLDAFSIGFRSIRSRRADDGAREIIEAALHEVSITPLAAYDGARVLAVRTPAKAFEMPGPMPAVNLTPLPPFVH